MTKKDIELQNSVASLKNRVAVTKYYFDESPKQVRVLAFTVSNLETLRRIQMVKKSLENAIDEGESFATWKSKLNTDILKSLSEARLETVYRTNVRTVYNQSTRYNAITSNVTPYLMYAAVGDERTRPEHLKLDGVIKRADSNFWDKYTPPLGFNCRCGTIPLSKEDADEQGINKNSINSFPEIDEGFENKRMGNVLSSVSNEVTNAINNLPNNSVYKSKLSKSQENIKNLVDLWYSKNQSIFNGE